MAETAISLNDRDSLIEEYREFAHQVVGNMIQTMNLPAAMFDEFVSAGYLGLVEAANRYDPAVGNDFRSYAFLRIRGSIIDSIRRCSVISGRAYKLAKTLVALNEAREIDIASGEESQDLAAIFNFASKAVLAFRMDLSETEIGEIPKEDMQPAADVLLEQKETLVIIKDLVNGLPDKEREILIAHYFEGKSFGAIAEQDHNLSRSWISRLHTRGLSILRKRYFELLELRDEAQI